MKDDQTPEDDLNAIKGVLFAILFSLPFWVILLFVLLGVLG